MFSQKMKSRIQATCQEAVAFFEPAAPMYADEYRAWLTLLDTRADGTPSVVESLPAALTAAVEQYAEALADCFPAKSVIVRQLLDDIKQIESADTL
jgi:hypothetical protein